MAHQVLTRQLRRLGIDGDGLPSLEQWQSLLQRVSRSYGDADVDRYTMERSVEVSSAEMQTLYQNLAREHEKLVESEERLRAVFVHTSLGNAVLDAQGRCAEPNTALQAMLGFTQQELSGRLLLDLIHIDDRAAVSTPLAELLASKRTQLAVEHRWHTKTGAPVWVNVAISQVRSGSSERAFAIIFAQDVTERKRMEMEVGHAQKLQSVGRLAAGLAHELNTPIQFINDNLAFLKSSAEAFSEVRNRYRALLESSMAAGSIAREEVDRIDEDADIAFLEQEAPNSANQAIEGAERMAAIVRAMREFAQNGHSEASMSDLNQALRNTLTVAHAELSRVAEIETAFEELPWVLCNLADINQVFLSILINAGHTIADVFRDTGVKGKIVVRTRREQDAVVVSISDTGRGIPEELHGRIFDPFFTTKEVGKGAGQGLAIARSIVVERHGGALRLKSRAGEGSTFEVVLPIYAAKQPSTPVPARARSESRVE